MARYIDAERLKMNFASGIRVYDGMCKIEDIIHNVNNAPTADVEEVVRCKDCRFLSCSNPNDKYCMFGNALSVSNDNSYCSYG